MMFMNLNAKASDTNAASSFSILTKSSTFKTSDN